MALTKSKPTEEDLGAKREMTVPELMIEECGLVNEVGLLMDHAKNQLQELTDLGDIATKEDEEKVRHYIRSIQGTINELSKLSATVVAHVDSKTKQVREHFTATLNAMKKTRLGLRSALLK